MNNGGLCLIDAHTSQLGTEDGNHLKSQNKPDIWITLVKSGVNTVRFALK